MKIRGRELLEYLIAMKEEKQELLEKMHEMETQLHIANENLSRMHEMETQLQDAKETLAKYVHEKQVCKSILSSNSSQHECVGAFEKHTRGIGPKLILKMGYEGKGLEKHAQGIVEPIFVEEMPRYLGLVYGQHDGELSKAKEAHEGVPRKNFITYSLP